MKKSTLLILVLLILSVSLVLFGCTKESSKKIAPKKRANPESVQSAFEKAIKAKNALESYETESKMDMIFDYSTSQVTLSLKNKSTIFSDPYRVKSITTMALGTLDSHPMETYIEKGEKTNGKQRYDVFINSDGLWEYVNASKRKMRTAKEYDLSKNMALCLDSHENFKEIGIEVINEKTEQRAIRYEGFLTGENLIKSVNNSGILKATAKDLTLDELNTLVTAESRINIKVWLDEPTGIPLKYELDTTELMNHIMETRPELNTKTPTSKTKVSKARITMVLNKINQAEAFKLPQEALDAKLNPPIVP